MKLKRLSSGIIVVIIGLLLALPASAQQCENSDKAFFRCISDACLVNGNCQICDIIQLFINVSQIILGFTGAAALLMFIIGGIMMITAYGHEDRVKMGKDTLIAAMTGIIIILISWIIMNAVIMGITNNKFNIENLLSRPELNCSNTSGNN